MDDALHNGQAHPGSFVLFGAVQALEDAKELVCICHIEADPIVLDKIDVFPSNLATADFDHSDLALAGKFEGIGQQIDQDLLEQGGIGLTVRQCANAKVNVPLFLHGAKVVECLPHQLLRRHRLLAERLTTQAREGQEIIDQLAHVLRVVPHELTVLLRLLSQL